MKAAKKLYNKLRAIYMQDEELDESADAEARELGKNLNNCIKQLKTAIASMRPYAAKIEKR